MKVERVGSLIYARMVAAVRALRSWYRRGQIVVAYRRIHKQKSRL